MEVLDRAGLEHRSCECYALVSKEYARLLPRPSPSAPESQRDATDVTDRGAEVDGGS